MSAALARWLTLGVLCCIAQSSHAQIRRPDRLPRPTFREAPFRFDVVTFAGKTPESVRTDIYTAVPFSLLEFLRTRDAYVADYAISVTLNDGASTLTDRYFTYHVAEPAAAHDLRVQKKQSRADAEQIALTLRPAVTFQLHLVLRDLHTRNELDTTFEIHTGDFRSLQPAMSSILLYRSRRGNRLVPAIGGDASELEAERGGLFVEAYNLHVDSAYGIVTEIIHAHSRDDKADEAALVVRGSVKAGSGTTSIIQSIPVGELWAGRYIARMWLTPASSDTSLPLARIRDIAVAHSEREITVGMSHGIPLASGDLDEAIEQLRLISTGFEWDSLERAHTINEKRDAIVEFWRKRNSDVPVRTSEDNAPMKIFYSRVEYANTHFQYSFTPGWKSDRGRLFIMLGPPETIEQHNYEPNEKPYEIWEYYRPMHTRYVFVDPYMLGDFRLSGAMPPDGTFVWDENE